MQFVAPDIGYPDLVVAAIEDHVFGQSIRICGPEDLIAMKKAADRPEDRIDFQRLEGVRRHDQGAEPFPGTGWGIAAQATLIRWSRRAMKAGGGARTKKPGRVRFEVPIQGLPSSPA